MMYSLFISCAKGLEYMLEEETKALGLQVERVNPQGVYGQADLATIYQICLWSRLANRVQFILFNGRAANERTIHQLCHQFAWQTVFKADKTFAVEFHGGNNAIRNTMFGAQVIKDAIVDHFRDLHNLRPQVDKNRPDILIHAYLKQDELTVSLDLIGYSLHQRGYRTEAGEAPLKETLAAAMLWRARWPSLAEKGYSLHDPFCGSGTLVIEAAMMAARIAPGLIRHDQALIHWVGHQPSLWERLRAQALQQVRPIQGKIIGTDATAKWIHMAEANAQRAGVSPLVSFSQLAVKDCRANAEKGLLIANPPYGERLGDATQLIPTYQQLGQVAHDQFQGWQMAFLTSNPVLAKALGLRSEKQYTLYNGQIECKLYCVSLTESNQLRNTSTENFSPSAQMFANRLRKNFQHLQKWAKRNEISCYRVYDADLPEFNFAIDYYESAENHQGYVVLQEYTAPVEIPQHKIEKRSLEVMQVVPHVLGVRAENLVVKRRKQQKGSDQYQKLASSHREIIVQEGKATLKVNLSDYLDTGLFLDHRPLRLEFAKLPRGTRFLNCFCYTATASVHAALAGAMTTNVDMSRTYLQWAENNFRLNHLPLSRHQFVQENCLEWFKMTRDRYDVIFLDPPSFSNSKRMTNTLDIQRDHPDLIKAAIRLLAPGGKLYFSTNLRHFKLAPEVEIRYEIVDVTQDTIDLDFQRNKRIHQCYLIKAR